MTLRPSLRRTYVLPDVVANAPLDTFIGIIIPEATTNLVTNPSIETATTNYTAVGGSIAQSATKQYHGVYSLAITPTAATTDGAFYGTITLTAATTYTLSCKFWGLPGVKYKISFATTGGVDLAVKPFIGTGRWQWVWITYTEASGASRRLYFTKNTHTSTGVFYVDGVQVEAKAYPTTYCDGDQLGLLSGQQPVPYNWTGTPHASTSYRTALTRAGGRVMDIKTAYGFLLTTIVGLGMAVPNNVSIPYTVLDGARYQRTTKPPRTISLGGRFQGQTRAQLDRMRSDMRQAVDRDLVPLQQPLVLMVEPRDDCGNPTGDFATVPCIYAGGLEGNETSAIAEDVAPTFTSYLPFLQGGDAGASLSVQGTVTNANAILKRSSAGVWSALGTGLTGGTPTGIARGFDGLYYVVGSFTAAGGVANTKFVASYNPATDTWAALGTGAGGVGTQVSGVNIAPNGNVWIFGAFTNMGGVAGATTVARWDGSVWNTVGVPPTAVPATGNALTATFDRLGNYYYPTLTNSLVVKWTTATSTWSTLGTVAGSGAFVRHVIRHPNGTALVIGGDFTTVNGTAAVDVAYWSGSAWSALATPPTDIVALFYGPDGVLYGGGTGGTTSNFFRLTGGAFQKIGGILGGGVDKIGPVPTNGSFAPGALVLLGGNFTTANNITLADGFGIWNGTQVVPADVDLPGAADVFSMAGTPDGTLIVGYNTTGSATAAAVTTVTNSGPSYVYPRLVIKGPSSGTSRIYQIVNYTTGAGIYLNYTINAGETAIYIFDPFNPQFFTTAPGYDDNGDLSFTVLPGSAPTRFYLAPGANSISFFAASSTVTASLSWKAQYNGTADLVN